MRGLGELSVWARGASLKQRLALLEHINRSIPAFADWPTQTDGIPVGSVGDATAFLQFEGHSLNVGGTGEGKFTSIIAPMLLHDVCDARGVPTGMVVIDPKNGEAARQTAPYRRTLREEQVYIIDPYQLAGGADALNPFDFLDPASPEFHEDCTGLALALIPQSAPGESVDRIWTSRGSEWLAAMIAHLAMAPGEVKTLMRLRSIFASTAEGFEEVLDAMRRTEGVPTWVVDAANDIERVTSKAEREASGYIATIRDATKFVDSLRMSAVLGHSTFDPLNIRRYAGTLYIVTKEAYLQQSAPWLRMVCELVRQRVSRPKIQRHIHWVIDEAKALGHWSFISEGLRALRAEDISLHLFYQNISQIRAVWRDGWGDIVDTRLVRFLGSNDPATHDWIAKLAGEVRIVDYTKADSTGHSATNTETKGTSSTTSDAVATSKGTSITEARGTAVSRARSVARAKANSFARQKGSSTSRTQSSSTGWSVATGRSMQDSYGSQSSSSSSRSENSSFGSTTSPSGFSSTFGNQVSSQSSSSSSSHSSTSFGTSFTDTKTGQSSDAYQSGQTQGETQGETSTETQSDGETNTDNQTETNATNSGTSTTSTTANARTTNESKALADTTNETFTQAERRRLMTLDEVRRMPAVSMLVFVNRQADCLIDKLHYHQSSPLLARVLRGLVEYGPGPSDAE